MSLASRLAPLLHETVVGGDGHLTIIEMIETQASFGGIEHQAEVPALGEEIAVQKKLVFEQIQRLTENTRRHHPARIAELHMHQVELIPADGAAAGKLPLDALLDLPQEVRVEVHPGPFAVRVSGR